MTEKLYYVDSHLAEFTACVTGCRMGEKGFLVSLDKTAFFPEGGGQAADTGYIGEARVLDVQEMDGDIWHLVSAPLPPGFHCPCRLDWEQRRRRMESHSGEHIVSGVAHRVFHVDNVGFHMGEDGVMTIDFNYELGVEALKEVERRANAVVRKDIEVKTWFPEEEELEHMDYRSKREIKENVRIVEIEGCDQCACCAPHVKRTGEVGLIKILDSQRHRGGTRITLVCGEYAYEDYCRKQESVTEVSRLLSAKRDEIAPAVERVLKENQLSRERCDRLSMAIVQLRCEAVENTTGNACVFDSVLDDIAQRELANRLMEKCGGIAAVFCGSDEEGWNYIIGSKNIDLRQNAKAINAAIEGRGGGSVQMIQGKALAKRETIEENIKSLSI
jgi:alanyl-tRNA synthetase